MAIGMGECREKVRAQIREGRWIDDEVESKITWKGINSRGSTRELHDGA
jgi:hypothetical protein